MSNSHKYYAGIGSRNTPDDIKLVIEKISLFLNDAGYTLRSGGANGADTYFEQHTNKKEIYLPYKGFNKNPSKLYNIESDALLMAEKFHPAWHNLTSVGQKLMARNCYQVLGFDLKTPVDFVVCYTTDGGIKGGTGQAMRVAEAYNIPVFNLYYPKSLGEVMSFVKRLKL